MRHSLVVGWICILAMGLVACVSWRDDNDSRAYYRVYLSEGDSIAAIASRYHTTPESIITSNKIRNVNQLKLGQMLKVPKGDLHLSLSPTEQAKPAVPAPESLQQPLDAGSAPTKTVLPKKMKRSAPDESKGLLFSENAAPLIWPVAGKLSSEFGWRRGRLHAGVDLVAQSGAPVLAAAQGEVIAAKWERGYGNMLVIKHGKFTTLYGHLSKILTREGAHVEQGDKIGMVGRSGNARGYHLHFEYRDRSGNPLNPMSYFPADRLISVASR